MTDAAMTPEAIGSAAGGHRPASYEDCLVGLATLSIVSADTESTPLDGERYAAFGGETPAPTRTA
jgi:hypothetical protein